ncbi:MAG: 8-oxoguanine DNA glycosylase [Chloroflexi bacterium]|nr:8-oxoguanine DNA glycosylase [Chloroflexota bacterium]
MADERLGEGFLPLEEPLDLEATLASGQVFRWRWRGRWAWGVLGEHGYGLRHEEGGLRFRTTAPSLAAAETELTAFLRLEDKLGAIREALAWDRPVARAMARLPGLRLLRQDPWECLVSFACSSASNIPRISRNLEALAETYGWGLGGPRGASPRLYRFPDPGRLAEAGPEGLRRLGLGFRAEYVAGTAAAVASGAVDLLALRGLAYPEARGALLTLPGVGEKVADCVLAFSLDKREAFPVDRWVRRSLEAWYGHGPRARYGELSSWAQDRWGEYAGYVQQYLFCWARDGWRDGQRGRKPG